MFELLKPKKVGYIGCKIEARVSNRLKVFVK